MTKHSLGRADRQLENERPCDCAQRHQRFADGEFSGVIEPMPHQHEDARCSRQVLGIGGCPGLPHCRDWILGAYRAGETLAEVTGDGLRAFELAEQRRELEREFARRRPLSAPSAGEVAT